MRTSVTVPDWLAQAARDANPGTPFGVIVRDALVRAVPDWRRENTTNPQLRVLRQRMRIATAKGRLNPPEPPLTVKPLRPRTGRPTVPAPGSATPPKHRPRAGRASHPTA